MLKTVNKQKMDAEWVQLMKEAKKIGITTEEVRLFLVKNQKKNNLS